MNKTNLTAGTERISIDLPLALAERLRVYALDHVYTLTEVVIMALESWLAPRRLESREGSQTLPTQGSPTKAHNEDTESPLNPRPASPSSPDAAKKPRSKDIIRELRKLPADRFRRLRDRLVELNKDELVKLAELARVGDKHEITRTTLAEKADCTELTAYNRLRRIYIELENL